MTYDTDAPRSAYPSDLTDEEWSAVAHLVSRAPTAGRKRSVDEREIVNAVLYMWQSGCSWRMLPHDFPPWTIVYYYYRRWSHDGTLGELRRLIGIYRRQPARDPI